ncbi:hypothetical protein HCU40_25365 [Pseudanabaena biceps]|nr:hypothetical protein [Pseudanabaena biceps]
MAALSNATGGETIQLAPGNYGTLMLNRINFDVPVTIQGGNFAQMSVLLSSGLKFEGTKVDFVPDATTTSDSQAIRVWNSENIHFNAITLVGGLAVTGVDPSATAPDATGNVLGYPAGKAINFATSANCSITNSDISVFAKGVVFAGGRDYLVDGNNIHNLRTTPISGTVDANLTINNNHTWDSFPWRFGAQDHGDRIHIWTNGTAIAGLVITNNYLDQGAGEPMLGIYLDDNNAKLGFINTVISGNTLIDGQGQGVLLENVSGTVTNNTLIWSGYGAAYSNTPRFDVNDGSKNINFSGNTGPISIETGSTYINIVQHSGMVSEDLSMSAADRETIDIDFMVITGRNSYTLDATTSDLYFEGGTGNFVGTGNALANRIVGGVGNDTLIGNGGADRLEGKGGNDTYVVDNAAQTIYDLSGIDLVRSSISWTLQTGLENLTFIGTGGATLVGNNGPNIIIGGAGADRLVGGGGADSLQGGLGNDTYVIGNSSLTIIDIGGVDTIETSLNWTLLSGFENLTLTGIAVLATGNSGTNVLRGNAQNNILDGGAGGDTMYGGAGNDTYIVDNASDRVIEVENGVDAGGADTVRVSVATWTLSTGIETLLYIGSAAFSGTGNSSANTMTAGIGNDTLNGMANNDTLNGGSGNDIINGGAGSDTMTGGNGNDTFVFAAGQGKGDIITDFNGLGTAAGDVIEIRGWGAGTTLTALGGESYIIRDGISRYSEPITIRGRFDPSDVVFTMVVAKPAASEAMADSSTFVALSDAQDGVLTAGADLFSSENASDEVLAELFDTSLDLAVMLSNATSEVWAGVDGSEMFEFYSEGVPLDAVQHIGSAAEHMFLVIA